MSAEVWGVVAGLAILVVLVLINAYFVAAEYGLIASNRYRIEQMARDGSSRAGRVEQALTDVNSYILATQVGITLVGLALGAFGEPVIRGLVAPLFAWLPFDVPVLSPRVLSVVLSLVVVTYVTVLFAELIPKRVARQRPEWVALFAVGPLRFFVVLFHPLIWVLNTSANFLLTRFGIEDNSEYVIYTDQELRMIARVSEQGGKIDPGEGALVDRVFLFGDIKAETIMVPRTQIIGIEIGTRIADAAHPEYDGAMVYSRLPVYDGDLETIRGFVHIKDILAAIRFGRGDRCIRDIVRPILFVPQSVDVADLVRDLQHNRMHMAVLVDGFGSTSGLITMENCLEVLVLHIEDEDDPPWLPGKTDNAGSWTFEGRTTITAVREILPLGEVNDGYRTIAGYVLDRMGHIPKVGDTVETDQFLIRVDCMDHLRIAEVTVLSLQRDHGSEAAK